MNNKSYTESQIKEIQANKYVKKCTTKTIQFTDEFIKLAIKHDSIMFPW